MNWIEQLTGFFKGEEFVARGVIVRVSGPTPRAAGTSMLIAAGRHEGRIGRGQAMSQVLASARQLIERRRGHGGSTPWLRARLELGTGSVLGEPTGGVIVVLIEAFGAVEMAHLRELADRHPIVARPFSEGAVPQGMSEIGPRTPLVAIDDKGGVVECLETRRRHFHVYGTGLSAQALVLTLAGLPFEVIWHDHAPTHFPAAVPAGVVVDREGDPVSGARLAEPASFHAVMTSDHELDLAVCRAVLLCGGFGYLGVIGSLVKRERMLARLRAEQMPEALLARIACPIGLAALRSKSPPVMALSIAAEAMIALEAEPMIQTEAEPQTANAV